MNHDQILTALAALGNRLVLLAAEDRELRLQLRVLAQALLAATEELMPLRTAADSGVKAVGDVATDPALFKPTADDGKGSVAMEAFLAMPSAEAGEPLPELTLGRVTSQEPPECIFLGQPSSVVDLGLIEARCRLKAEGCRWAASRQRLLTEGASFATEIEPQDREIIRRARDLPNCFLWMCHASRPSPADLRLYEDVAGCFETLAEAVAIVRQIMEDPVLNQLELEASLDLLAEAQSAVRMAVAYVDGPIDSDQAETHKWLKTTAGENQIFIRRYIRADDPADPGRWPDLLARIESTDLRIQEVRRRERQRRKLLGKIRHKASLITDAPDAASEHWRILAASVEELVSDGLPPSNPQLRELLLLVLEKIPEELDVPRGLQLALREVDRFLATCASPEIAPAIEETSEVRQVAELLRGRSVALIGGERRPGSEERLKTAFGLAELLWVETREHQSIDGFEPIVARPEVVVVLLAIRWSSHSFGDVQKFCERHGKPLVRLPGGYSPNQVAAQILAQASERIAAV